APHLTAVPPHRPGTLTQLQARNGHYLTYRTLTAATVVTMILVARAAVVCQSGRGHATRTGHPPRRRTTPRDDRSAPPAEALSGGSSSADPPE
ncbi:hypothetical protein, partial [Streptomyces mirabilis]|uniref:hypothetical protein n=1 Tax=Streptomyces mirabilis TaxID=68239 RepID=UPI0033B725E1